MTSYEEGLEAYRRGDYETALKEFRPLAEQGFASSQFNLGLMYARGQGVAQDYVQPIGGTPWRQSKMMISLESSRTIWRNP